MPKRDRSGDVSSPVRVVAPMSVKRSTGTFTDRALGPWPITMSTSKSSRAGYRISSMAGDIRWISSMNSTSLAFRLVTMPTRSPGFSIAGPDVARMGTPISLAMTCASVVLPRPGGPCSST